MYGLKAGWLIKVDWTLEQGAIVEKGADREIYGKSEKNRNIKREREME